MATEWTYFNMNGSYSMEKNVSVIIQRKSN